MPASQSELEILITARDQASQQLRALGSQVSNFERQVESTSGTLGRMGGALQSLGQIGLAAGGIGAIVSGFQGAIGAVGGLVQGASDLNEQLSRTGQVFGEASQQVVDFSKTTAQALGITQTEALEAAGSFGTLFRTTGLSEDAAADMSTQLVRLAADLASFNNIDPREALDKLRSGLVGEAEPLRSVGVLLSEDAVKAQALAMGLGAAGRELTEGERVQARFALILRQTTQAQGDFARTSTGLANSQRILRASWADLTTTLGQALLPTVARAAQFLAQQMPAALQAVQRVTDVLGPALAALFSGDLQGAMDRAVALVGAGAAALAPRLAEWTAAFLAWVQEMTPRLLQFLGEKLGDLWAWIRETAPPLLRTAIGEWIPAFVDWLEQVGPLVTAALIQMLSELATWITTTGVPQMAAFGNQLGDALVGGTAMAFDKLGPRLGAAIDKAVRENPLVDVAVRAVLAGVPAGAVLTPEVRAAVSGSVMPPGRPPPTSIDIGPIHLGLDWDPRAVARQVGDAVTERVFEALSAAAAGADNVADRRLQGAGR